MVQNFIINWLDWCVLGIIAISGFVAYRRGLIMTIYRFTYLILNIILTKMFYPTVSEMIIAHTNFNTYLSHKIGEALNIQALSENLSIGDKITHINGLKLPESFKMALLENNNYEAYDMLGVNGFGDYIATYLANLTINIVSIILVFIALGLALKFVVHIFDIIAKLPILNSLNKLTGLCLGLVMGLLMVWLMGVGIGLFYTIDSLKPLVEVLEDSGIALWLYQHNLLQDIFLSIII